MKQGRDFVYVKVSLGLFQDLGSGWTPPVRLRLREEYNGDIELISRKVTVDDFEVKDVPLDD